jgi:predicted transcriptional regulator
MGGIINSADVAHRIVEIGKVGKTRLARCLGILQAVVAIYEAGGRMGSGRTVVEVESVISASSMQAGHHQAG